ncbi:NUDIX hydrolase [Persicitalea sp.]|uniref:NUDIX hydrolase n=1 Tax=Persicitalea sp. TaxID=3100273 RepID=UPI0035945979
MILFLNDRPVQILRPDEAPESENEHYDHIVDLRLTKFKATNLTGHVLLINATASLAAQIVDRLEKHPEDLLSVTMICKNKKEAEEKIKSQYKVLKAAGGIVLKNNQWLLMFRRKKWDLPKGKLDPGERSRKAAVREIEEETGVKAKIKSKICTTWHTYTLQNNRIMKRTKWYVLECQNDTAMKPQAEEDIERLEWLAYADVQKALINSFSSIRYVVERLHRMQGS